MDRRAAATLTEAGYDPTGHRAQYFEQDWFDRFDVLLAMDADNQSAMRAVAPEGDEARVVMFRAFDPDADGDLDVPDPWYSGGPIEYEDVLAIVERTTDRLLGDLVVMAGQTT
jgi:protein-tyrosine phosphatase